MKRWVAVLLMAGALGGVTTTAQVLPDTGPLSKQSMDRLLLIDAERLGNRIVAVGDRGYIVYSDDHGATWKRAKTPPGPLLAAVTFADAKTGWAVGHDSQILGTTDGGEIWTKLFSAESEQRPLLDVLFLDKSTGFAVGAYGAFYATTDGGKTWNARKVLESAPVAKKPAATGNRGDIEDKGDEDRHLNSIVRLKNGNLLIAGEAGTLLLSTDNGAAWTKLASPYKGSYFGTLEADDGAVVIFGLRGKIFRSTDAARKDWKLIDNPSVATLMGGTRLPDGALVIAGAAGTVLVSRDNGASFTAMDAKTTRAFSKALLGAPNAVLLLGEAGARDVLIPSAKR